MQWKTREILVGNVGVGGDNPIRIQSMTTSDTKDIPATIDQIMRLKDSGCEIARVTVQGMQEAKACEGIKNGLLQKGYDIPLVADIHFYPPAAMHVVDFVDKVRINPGNFVDRRATFRILQYDEKTYAEEVAKIEEKFAPLVEKCIKLKRAMRIGTNHGSLSDRIMNWHGDTPFGMVESAFEFARVCRKMDFHHFCFSMKASNPLVMIEAYRLLVKEMMKIGWDYPLHLGVTEAGEGEDGRIKSAVGTGSLLLEGIGDTIRVSLTEDPWEEIDPCKRLIKLAKKGPLSSVPKREKKPYLHRDGCVILPLNPGEALIDGPDAYLIEEYEGELGDKPIFARKGGSIDVILPSEPIPEKPYALWFHEEDDVSILKKAQPECVFYSVQDLKKARAFIGNCPYPVILSGYYPGDPKDLPIHAGAKLGALLADGLGDGVAIGSTTTPEERNRVSFTVLQACRMRTTKTEFISCPGCGRTLFDLQEVAARIREKTAHLPGVKIAIMGCIVNGPGEMADADFGYVGSKPGKIDLYVGKTCVERNIDFSDADDRLINLIKENGRWVEPNQIKSTV